MTTSQWKQDALLDEFLAGCTDPKPIFSFRDLRNFLPALS